MYNLLVSAKEVYVNVHDIVSGKSCFAGQENLIFFFFYSYPAYFSLVM